MKHGLGAIETLADQIKALGVTRPMVVTDKGVVKVGLFDQAAKSLKAGGLDYVLFDQVYPNPAIELVDRGAAIYAREKCDGLIGLGGGSPMDTAKAIGVVATNGGSILNYEWADPQPIKTRIPPLVTVPTTAGTGSEVTLWSVITDPKRHVKFNVGGTGLIGAYIALLDPLLTLDLPPSVTSGTGMDALTHAIECYTGAPAQPLPDSVALLAMEYIGKYLRIAYAQGHNQEARYKMSMAAMLAGLAYGTESAGAVHAMSQTAGGVYDCPHGLLTAALLAPVMRFNYMGEPEKFARIALALGEDTRGLSVWDAAELAVDAVERLSRDLRIPSLAELGVKEADIPMLAKMAFNDPQTIGNPRDITEEDYARIYRSCFGK
jgi:choline dehydrogenase